MEEGNGTGPKRWGHGSGAAKGIQTWGMPLQHVGQKGEGPPFPNLSGFEGRAHPSTPQGVHVTALREMKLLRELHHPNIIRLIDVFPMKKNIGLVGEAQALGPACPET